MNITCPYCQKSQVVQGEQHHNSFTKLDLNNNEEGDIGIVIDAITCANEKCRITLLMVTLTNALLSPIGRWVAGSEIDFWRLRPQSVARILPDYIPKALVEDYTEACRIKELSPKAAATLIRRCLQGMIRDFCGITQSSLYMEIETLRKLVNNGEAPRGVSDESVDAIDQIRGIGNIGAHMEKDIDLIIPVDAHEAQLLIELTEMLFDEWYIAREKRVARLTALKEVADSKKSLRAALPAPDIE